MDVSAPELGHNNWLSSYISPGPVGSIGDPHLHTRLKHSAPDLPLRWDPSTSGANLLRTATHLTDGDYPNKYGSGRLIDHNWNTRRVRRYVQRKIFSTGIPEDCTASAIPLMGPTPQFKWKNQVASVYKSLHTGNLFLPMEGGYELKPGDLGRGGNVPRVVASITSDAPFNIPEAPTPTADVNRKGLISSFL